MNNEQFRKLMLANASSPKTQNTSNGKLSASNAATRTGLGSRQRSNIPMTPRSLGNTQADFARQVANRATQPHKKFKSSAPKGVKLGDGYIDRSRRPNEDDLDDLEEKIRALDQSYTDEKIDKQTYERLRSEYVGGDLETTHLVKGLDFKLLQRIRDGEDIYKSKKATAEGDDALPNEKGEGEEDIDVELDALEAKEVQAIEREAAGKKKGQFSTVSLVPGKKRTRDQILAEMKATRDAAKAPPESTLGSRFSKIGEKKTQGTRIEKDAKGREVMIIVDADGNEKRKVRKVQQSGAGDGINPPSDMVLPDKNVAPLGMEVPEHYRRKEEPEEDQDVDIFDDVGDDYNPLAGMDGSDLESSEDGEESVRRGQSKYAEPESKTAEDPKPQPPPVPVAARNYFQGSKTGLVSEHEASKAPSMSDPAIMAAIKRAAAIQPVGGSDEDTAAAKEKQRAEEERRRKMLESSNRDDADMDMGFGTSRFEDEEDFDDAKVKLSKWGGGGDDDDEKGGSRGGQGKRKRGPKKRKGDANSAADVLRVMDQRKRS